MTLLRFALSLLALLIPAAAFAGEVSSPDGRIVATLDANGEGTPIYSVTFDREPVINESTIGFNFTDANPMRRGFEVVSEVESGTNTTWEQPWGERRFVVDHHNELAVTYRQNDDEARMMTVRMRVFDDGIGFRIEFPEQESLPVANIAEELTEFRIASATAKPGPSPQATGTATNISTNARRSARSRRCTHQ